jgi:hypothetical protein
MGQAARAWVLDHYVNEHVLGRTVRYYESLLAQYLRENSKNKPITPTSAFNPGY